MQKRKQGLFGVLLFLLPIISFGQDRSVVKIDGFAPEYVGKKVEVYAIEDYLSMVEKRIASSKVEEDSTFSIVFFADTAQKVIVKSANNWSYIYIQPKGKYEVFLPKKSEHDPYRPAGNEVEMTFYNLDTLDINYRILRFNRWMDNFMFRQFKKKMTETEEFNQKLDEFKENAEKYYAKDTGEYIYDYVRFSIAGLDNIQQAGQRNRYEKHDFYLKYNPVLYKNDAYMNYFNSFYEEMVPRLSMEANNRVYLGVLKSSPTKVMQALGMEYTLVNTRIRELIMIKSLAEEYHKEDFPQTNIITILDSVANHGLFQANRPIAKHIVERLTKAVQGGKAPTIFLKKKGEKPKMLADYKEKYLYIHFFDPSSEKNTVELPILNKLYTQYKDYVEFISICPKKEYTKKEQNILNELNWEAFTLDKGNAVWNNYSIETFPNYVLIDPTSHVAAAPALSPQPNGSYETIDYTFFQIKKVKDRLRGD